MRNIKPADTDTLRSVRSTLEMANYAIGFVPNSTQYIARRKFVLATFQTMYGAIMGTAPKVSLWAVLKHFVRTVWFGMQAKRGKYSHTVPTEMLFLVAHAASTQFQCSYCQAHTVMVGINNGLPPAKLKELPNYKTSEVFTDAERAVIEFGIASTKVPTEVTPAIWEALKTHFNDDQILDLHLASCMYGFLNRFNDVLATRLEDQPMKAASETISDRWSPGKHAQDGA